MPDRPSKTPDIIDTMTAPTAVPATTVDTAVSVENAEVAAQVAEVTEVNETPAELIAVIEKMKATAEKHNFFGFGTAEALAAFFETLPKKLSPDSLATIRALKPRETKESYTVFFKDGAEIYLGESAPSSKGADGKKGGGLKIAATKADRELDLEENSHRYSATSSVEELFVDLEAAGARGIVSAPEKMLNTLRELRLSSWKVPLEVLSDVDLSGGPTVGYAGNGSWIIVQLEGKPWGVRVLRNVTLDTTSVPATTVDTVGMENAEVAAQVAEVAEVKETPEELLTAVIEKMKATAEKHNYFGFGTPEELAAFFETLPKKLSPDSLATIRALKPRETEESYIVFFIDGAQIYLGESAPSSKGADGKEGNGVSIAATEADKIRGLNYYNQSYSTTGSASKLFTELKAAGAKDLLVPSDTMLMTTLLRLKLFSSRVPVEWLGSHPNSDRRWSGAAERGSAAGYDASYADGRKGVRALRNVTKELGA